MRTKLPTKKSVSQDIMNLLRIENPHIFVDLKAKNFASLEKGLQFDMGKGQQISIISIGDDKYNIRINKAMISTGIAIGNVIEMLKRGKEI